MSADVMATRTIVSRGVSILGAMLAQPAVMSSADMIAPRAMKCLMGADLRLRGVIAQTLQHVARDDRHALLAHVEAPRVLRRIDADTGPRRDVPCGVDDRVLDEAVRADPHVGEYDCALQIAALADAHVREQQ